MRESLGPLSSVPRQAWAGCGSEAGRRCCHCPLPYSLAWLCRAARRLLRFGSCSYRWLRWFSCPPFSEPVLPARGTGAEDKPRRGRRVQCFYASGLGWTCRPEGVRTSGPRTGLPCPPSHMQRNKPPASAWPPPARNIRPRCGRSQRTIGALSLTRPIAHGITSQWCWRNWALWAGLARPKPGQSSDSMAHTPARRRLCASTWVATGTRMRTTPTTRCQSILPHRSTCPPCARHPRPRPRP